ncbi:hypothetical protein FNJ84_16825 [Paracoccus sp. M683]|uniref:pore-forming ESAT-6 family protein n=1 Tax=Paracoccus sp. M683 TaxID=2594268 RepID=UPI00117DCB7C|nr:pore-forming ESAT-6 family protein [Paracoccus sp. M683]TRW95164.1 hypothetical protein FNJ84_16825 [Paracoccus sp. M683]
MCKKTVASLSLIAAITAGAAWAQDTQPAPEAAPEAPAAAPAAPAAQDPQPAYDAARNQLGILGYCQDQGHIDGGAVEIQTKMLTMVPAGDVAQGDAAEAKGKEGAVSGLGVETTLADAATQQGTTEAALCQQMDAMIKQAGAALPAE